MKWTIVDLLGGKITGGIQGNQNSHGVSFILGTSKMMDVSADVDAWHVAGAFDSTKKMGGGSAKWTYLRGWFGFLPAPHLEIWFEEFSQNRIVHLYNYLQEDQGTKLGLLSASCMVAVPKLTWLLLGLFKEPTFDFIDPIYYIFYFLND